LPRPQRSAILGAISLNLTRTRPEETPVHSLHQLTRLYGVETAYFDIVAQRRRQATPEVLLAVLRALGAPVEKLADAPAAARARRLARWQRAVEPVTVAWEGTSAILKLRLPAQRARGRLACRLELESGETRKWTCALEELPTLAATEIEGARYLTKKIELPAKLPLGYHRLALTIGRKRFETLVIAAPVRAFAPRGRRSWGVFLPLYSLRTLGSWGAGDFTDLEALLDWVGGLGGGMVGTVPLLSAMLDEPFEPSPYAPASRLFWNEFFVDVTRAPEMAHAPKAKALLNSAEFRAELDELRAEPLVDYRRGMSLKREVLRELARVFFAGDSKRRRAFARVLKAEPRLDDYARFRAAGERWAVGWREWPARQREGRLRAGDYEEESRRYHLYAQWLAQEQLEALGKKARADGPGLYLDLPLGTHPDGYDVWRERGVFLHGLAAGAPPDSFFVKGQNWGFPPLHPERLRAQSYRYFIACLRHHLRVASALRIDHVMSLHHLFMIPPGVPAYEGTYVRYRPEEFYAILALESQRHKALIVGEDLGTVPPYVRPALARHGIQRSWVLPFEMEFAPPAKLVTPHADSAASLNTHDLRPLHGFWQGLDLQDRLEMRLMEPHEVEHERGKRDAFKHTLVEFLARAGWLEGEAGDPGAILRGCLKFLAAGPARLVLVNLEDLWLETEQQNTPGTRTERPNWRRRARYALEAFCQMPAVTDTLREIQRQRARAKKK